MKRQLVIILSIICALALMCSCAPANVADPTIEPTIEPTNGPTNEPTEAPTPAPTKDPYLHYEYTKTTFFDFTDRENKIADPKEDIGWPFKDKTITYAFQDGKLVLSGMVDNEFYRQRIDLSEEQKENNCSATAMDANNALAIYVENNSDVEVGFCYFGELKLPDDDKIHQNTYESTLFDDLSVYLMDLEGNMVFANEYNCINTNYYDKGLVEIPANFKGYYIVGFDSFGKDLCYYAIWGDHDAVLCDNGAYVKGASINAVGFCVLKEINEISTDTFVIGEYCFMNIGGNNEN